MFIIEFMKTCEHDKQLHYIAGIILGFATLYDLFFGLCILHVVAIGKEVYDHYMPNHTTDFNDYTATVAGGLVSTMVISLILKVT